MTRGVVPKTLRSLSTLKLRHGEVAQVAETSGFGLGRMLSLAFQLSRWSQLAMPKESLFDQMSCRPLMIPLPCVRPR
uniref:Uncharacterized protein n=1 Tax=Leersia perrieri TaxID=77586 RepID=A0A0D9VXZ8_9ORYZ